MLEGGKTRGAIEAACTKLGEHPRIWYRIPGYVVRNYSPDLEKSVLKHMSEIFAKEEPIFRGSGVADDPVSVAELQQFGRRLLQQNISMIALSENSPASDLKPIPAGTTIPVAGVNLLRISYSDDPPRPSVDVMFKGIAVRKALGNCMRISGSINFFERFGVDKTMDAAGLSVHPDDRRRGVGEALLRARIELCRALGITITKTLFTAPASQRIALRCGFQTLAEVYFRDIKNEKGQLEFPNIPGEDSATLTVRTIDID